MIIKDEILKTFQLTSSSEGREGDGSWWVESRRASGSWEGQRVKRNPAVGKCHGNQADLEALSTSQGGVWKVSGNMRIGGKFPSPLPSPWMTALFLPGRRLRLGCVDGGGDGDCIWNVPATTTLSQGNGGIPFSGNWPPREKSQRHSKLSGGSPQVDRPCLCSQLYVSALTPPPADAGMSKESLEHERQRQQEKGSGRDRMKSTEVRLSKKTCDVHPPK